MPGGIAGPSSPRGYKYGTWSSMLGVGRVVDYPTPQKIACYETRNVTSERLDMEEVHYGGEGWH